MSDDDDNNAGGIVVDGIELIELGSASVEEAWEVRLHGKKKQRAAPRLPASGELPAEIVADIDYDNDDGTVRGGLAAVLRTYVPNVECSKLVRDANYDCIALVDLGDDGGQIVSRRGVVGGACFRVWRHRPDCIFVELSLLAIEVGYQGRGLASRILAALEERVKRGGAKSVLTYADERAFAFFRRLGFSRNVTTPFAVWKSKVTDYSDGAVIAEKRLDVASNSSFTVREEDALSSKAVITGAFECSSGKSNCYCKSGRTRAIVRYDETGVLETYCSTSSAARKLGLTGPQITHVLSGKLEQVGKHKFRYAVEVPWVRSAGPRAIVEIDVATGRVVREFTSAVHCARICKISNSVIGEVCNGKKAEDPNGAERIFRWKEQRVYPCSFCKSDHDSANLLLCDGNLGRCASTAHTYCIGLETVPEGEWLCKDCSSAPTSFPQSSRVKKRRKTMNNKITTTTTTRKRSSLPATRREKPPCSLVVRAGARVRVPTQRLVEQMLSHNGRQRKTYSKELSESEESSDDSAVPEEEEDPDPNEDFCEKCKFGGQLLCCDTCPRAYHAKCASLPRGVPQGDWSCPICTRFVGNRSMIA